MAIHARCSRRRRPALVAAVAFATVLPLLDRATPPQPLPLMRFRFAASKAPVPVVPTRQPIALTPKFVLGSANMPVTSVPM